MATEKEKEAKAKAEIPKDAKLLKEISKLETQLAAKRKEYSAHIASVRKVNPQASLSDCIKLSRRDDLNSDRRDLKKVTAAALDKLKKNR